MGLIGQVLLRLTKHENILIITIFLSVIFAGALIWVSPAQATCSGQFECGTTVRTCIDNNTGLTCNSSTNPDPPCHCTTQCQSTTNPKDCATGTQSTCTSNRCSAGCNVLAYPGTVSCSWSNSCSQDSFAYASCTNCNYSTNYYYNSDCSVYASGGQSDGGCSGWCSGPSPTFMVRFVLLCTVYSRYGSTSSVDRPDCLPQSLLRSDDHPTFPRWSRFRWIGHSSTRCSHR